MTKIISGDFVIKLEAENKWLKRRVKYLEERVDLLSLRLFKYNKGSCKFLKSKKEEAELRTRNKKLALD